MIDMTLEGKHAWDGACAGNKDVATFSVGIFEWVRTWDGKSLKRSKVKYRVKGPSHMADEIYARAKEVCGMLDNGWVGKKSETIG
jgi:hypothetical protein